MVMTILLPLVRPSTTMPEKHGDIGRGRRFDVCSVAMFDCLGFVERRDENDRSCPRGRFARRNDLANGIAHGLRQQQT
jgi:hypothetical protein